MPICLHVRTCKSARLAGYCIHSYGKPEQIILETGIDWYIKALLWIPF